MKKNWSVLEAKSLHKHQTYSNAATIVSYRTFSFVFIPFVHSVLFGCCWICVPVSVCAFRRLGWMKKKGKQSGRVCVCVCRDVFFCLHCFNHRMYTNIHRMIEFTSAQAWALERRVHKYTIPIWWALYGRTRIESVVFDEARFICKMDSDESNQTHTHTHQQKSVASKSERVSGMCIPLYWLSVVQYTLVYQINKYISFGHFDFRKSDIAYHL